MIDSDLKTDINTFLMNYGIWIAVGVAVIIAFCVVFLLIRNRKVSPKKTEEKVVSENSDEWLIALGNKENILEADATGSRLNIKLNDNSLLNKEKLKELGALSIIEMSGKFIIVVEGKAEEILAKIR